jgi:hypothetical protein
LGKVVEKSNRRGYDCQQLFGKNDKPGWKGANGFLTGRLAEGEPLHEAKLAERFGARRGPIREVLAQLTQVGG